MSSAICFNLDQSKILSSGNGLKNGKMLNVYDIASNVLEHIGTKATYEHNSLQQIGS